MNLSLYQIEKEYLLISEELKDNGGELTEELETALAINQENLQVKATNYAFVIKDTEHEVNALDAEIERLNGLKKSRTASIDRLKFAIKTAMNIYGVSEIKTDTIKLKLGISSAVEIEDESIIPDEFKEVVETIKISKKSIGEQLRKGLEVEGAYLKENISLLIK